MYIKIKHIKQSLLVLACLFFAGFNYFSYVKADDTKNNGQKTCDKTVDADCDGLTDTEEKLYGTDLNNDDSDNDGYSDGVEIESGYDPLRPAPGDRVAVAKSFNQIQEQNLQSNGNASSSLTESYMQEFRKFIDSKNGQAVTVEDINEFNDVNLAASTTSFTIEDLPEVDASQIKTISQSYANLSKADKNLKIQQDSVEYLSQILYLLINNAPMPISNADDFEVFKKDFENRMSDLSNQSNLEYFSDLGDRLILFSEQLNNLQVPETMIDQHVKFARIVKGFLLLKTDDTSDASMSDPMGKIVTLNKVGALTNIFGDFLTNDFANYFKQIAITE